MICIDMQGEEHHCQEEQDLFTYALIGRFLIGALYSTKLGVIAQGFVWEGASAMNP
jgi:hypothetical protein